MEKIWLVTQESMVNGEILFNVVPCNSFEKAKSIFDEEINAIFNEDNHFGGHTAEEREELFDIEQEEDKSFFIFDPCDDYYESILMYEKEIQK